MVFHDPQFQLYINGFINKIPFEDAKVLSSEHERTTLSRNDQEVGRFFRSLDIDSISQPHHDLDGFISERNKERLVDLAGKGRLIEGNLGGARILNIEDISTAISPGPDADTVYVIGHRHPDADSIVSSAFEAARRQLVYGKPCVAWSDGLPHVFGPINDIVLVDRNSIDGGHEHQVRSIIDHHIPRGILVVNCPGLHQVARLGPGSDGATARELLEATLLEAEPDLAKSMSVLDNLILGCLKTLASEYANYPDLMAMMTNDTTLSDPFVADYKERLYGFVVKTRIPASYEQRAKTNIERHLSLSLTFRPIYRDIPPIKYTVSSDSGS
ncbi:hypothetical protein B0T26DRAFT_797156 [Lasiosphaeria miniovina]|uniref:Uncharacterized protein n=1 Tax=Lasiosphaeria miniovina TaxID=1954250 RepID=A0AA40EC98_9PEZI|nr:uncharacterized protein B0T26DRAFT_797156 [Lasiosphaeria miniovina]KAK0733012.1 hypothetical protein B0T26DRAFT_797156 [Lasiosphaeria miniovina]